ncbi:MAG TPA: L-histidine N(alpha)-methyltransferase [Deltaproteobacteria bacterium]|nr:L-histidine N(alpha)-methyltransferase [Deltaproteobacteria bacterium]
MRYRHAKLPNTSPDFEYDDFNPPETLWWKEALAGLQAKPKAVPPKFFYDQHGSRLFERITQLPEYYLTRAEIGLLKRHASDIARVLGPDCELLEFGCGNSQKVFYLLAELRCAAYVAVDICKEHLWSLCGRVAAAYPGLPVHALRADFSRPLDFPPSLRDRGRRVVFFPGSSIGNFDPEEAVRFLIQARRTAGPQGRLLIGVDLKKDRALLEAAYDDAAGVTASFNKNLLWRLNRECGADFDLNRFRHRAFYNEAQGRIEMHLESLCRQEVSVPRETSIHLFSGETIHTENSYKYEIAEFQALAARAGWRAEGVWCDERDLFSVQLFG